MPQYYRFGYQGARSQAEWNGRPQQSQRARTDDLAGLGDVECSQLFHVAPKQNPYAIHKAHYERKAQFYVPPMQSPYYIHKYEWPTPPYQYLSGLQLSNMEKNAAIAVGVGAAAWFFLLRKGAPLRKTAKRKPKRRR